jgi:DNA-binding transcriptional LysR family regulator
MLAISTGKHYLILLIYIVNSVDVTGGAVLDVRKLRMLSELDRLGTIAAVAAELHLSAPGVSMQLGALERELGVPLTRRQGRRVALTAAGRVLASHGHDILDRISLAELELDALRSGTTGRYTVTAFPSAARTILAETCRRVLADDDLAVAVHVTTHEPEDALAALSSGEADLAVIHAYSNVPRDVPPGITTRGLGTDPVWFATSDAEAGSPVRLQDHADDPWITPTDDLTCFDMVERACGLAGFRPRVVAESMDFSVQLELVAAGLGVALVPDLTVVHVPDGVRLLPLAEPVERTLVLATRSASLADPGIRNLARIIEQTAASRLLHPTRRS